MDSMATRFEAARPMLTGVAYRMLGSGSEADDAVQEAWLRFSRVDAASIDNPEGWLTTAVARVCLDMLRARARAARRESPTPTANDSQRTGHVVERVDASDAEHETQVADAVGLALLVVLDRLSPAERVAFVLHDAFDLSFGEIAPIVGRTPAAARQLASRARRRVR